GSLSGWIARQVVQSRHRVSGVSFAARIKKGAADNLQSNVDAAGFAVGREDEERRAGRDCRSRRQRQSAWSNQDTDRSAVADSWWQVAREDRKVCVARVCWTHECADQRLRNDARASVKHAGCPYEDGHVFRGQGKDADCKTQPDRAGRAALRNDRARRWEATHLPGRLRAGHEHRRELAARTRSEWLEVGRSFGAAANANSQCVEFEAEERGRYRSGNGGAEGLSGAG